MRIVMVGLAGVAGLSCAAAPRGGPVAETHFVIQLNYRRQYGCWKRTEPEPVG